MSLQLGWHERLQQEFDPAGARASVGSEAWRQYVEYNAWAAVKELTEFADEVEIRPWKRPTGVILDQAAALEELVDVLFFIANLALAIGADEEQLKQAYVRKMRENFDRLERGRSHAAQTDDALPQRRRADRSALPFTKWLRRVR